MSPTVFRQGPYRFYFFSREEPRPHVHVQSSAGEAKFWLEPEIALAQNTGLSARELRAVQRLIEERADELRIAWDRHFGP
jgi:Domain of unknown function (DUF4160)